MLIRVPQQPPESQFGNTGAAAHPQFSPQIQPDLRELMETMNRMSHLPPDFEGRQKVNQW